MGGSLAALYIVFANRQQQDQEQDQDQKPEQPYTRGTQVAEGNLKVLGALIVKAAPMHEKLLEDQRKDKAEKVQLLGNNPGKERPREKPLKQSKLAERLRRSFRRREHSSLEIKRCESHSESEFHHTRHVAGGAPALATTDTINLVGQQQQQQHYSFPTPQTLAGLSLGGHINTALLLDSPDECTPPEYAYQHLSSVATTNTNSSSSLESSYELSELRDSQTSIYYWACPKNSEMGSEMSTTVTSTNITELPGNVLRRQLQSQSSGAAANPANLPPANSSSRSCSLTSDSSSARITRLQNFLFKNSNESSRSCQGHSNDGFTASSFNSSSGEWEQLGVHGAGGVHDLTTGSFPEEETPFETDVDATLPNESSDAGPYYQYTLTSPNNPFLPEITARSYHSNYRNDEAMAEVGGGGLVQEELQLDCNVTSVKYTGSGGSAASRCAQLPTPVYSRAGSQESSFSESIISGPAGPTPSPASSSSSTPGRHRRKLFSLNSPTRLQQQQQQHQTNAPTVASLYQQQQQQQYQKIEMSASPPEGQSQGTPMIRTLNPFLGNATSPIAVPSTDLRSKREEFLRATMKICLVVSPPASKLQLKSKSLTHLDGLNTVASCHHGSAAPSRALPSPKTTVPAELLQQQTDGVQSSEYFTVSFSSETGQYQDEIYLPVTKGVTLENALRQELHRRNLNFSQITVTDNKAAFSNLDAAGATGTNVLDEYTDVESLAGHYLVVSERDGSRKTLQKAASFGSRQRPPRLLSSASTEETSELATAPSKQIRQRWSSIFGVKNPQQSQLYELLNCYAKNGVPQRAGSLGFDHPTLSDSLKYLQNMDKSWRDFVESRAMSVNEVKIQTAIWELVTTEVDYIHALQTVTDLFLACLEAVQEERLLIEVDQHRLFSNIRAVCDANIKFWTLWLFPMVAHSIRTHEPLQCAFFHEGFITFASTFAPYKAYCAEQSTCQFYCKELNQNNTLFTAYLAWCESQKMCNRLRLADIVVRPMQRLTKYSLLLTAIRKHMDDVEQIEAMDRMIHSVENFVGSVNNHLTMRQESERLKGVMARIESYDVVDTNNETLEKLIKQHSQMFDLCAPMRGCAPHQVRHLFMEGDHKFKDNVSKSDVHCFLLTDILLVCKSIAKKGLGALKVIRQPYLTDHLIVHQGHNNTLNCVYLNEFQVATTAFTLQCTEAKNWYDALRRAKSIYQRLKRGISANYGDSFRFTGSTACGTTVDSLGVRKSPMNSSIGSHVSSANNSHSGSVEWNDSRNISVDFDKTNSMSSDEGFSIMGNQAQPSKGKQHLLAGFAKPKIGAIAAVTANTLSVQPLNHLGQSLPNLSMQHIQTNNTLLVPGTTTSHSGNMLLSPSHRGISYPPPSPTRVPLRRGMAFSTSTKNPPLLKTRNITSQNSINWHQIPSTPTPTSPRSQQLSPGHIHKGSLQQQQQHDNQLPSTSTVPVLQKQISHKKPSKESMTSLQRHLSTETDV